MDKTLQKEYLIYLKLGDSYSKTCDKLTEWKKGYKLIPQRLECIHRMVTHYRDKKEYTSALKWAKKATNLELISYYYKPEEMIYQCGFDIDYAMVAYYCEEYQLAYDINTKNIKKNDSMKGTSIYNLMLKNQKFYDKKINKKAIIKENKVSNLNVKLNDNYQPNVIVIDNFYSNPDEVRNFALTSEFNVKGNYPGLRTESYATDELKEKFEKILGKKIKFWPNEYNGSFQYTTENKKSWIHRDKTDYSCIIYLTPNPPSDGGTVLYKHKITNKRFADDEIWEKILSEDSNDEDRWDVLDVIGNVYNRCVIFNGKLSHKSNKYFGDCLENSRLFQTFFFDVYN